MSRLVMADWYARLHALSLTDRTPEQDREMEQLTLAVIGVVEEAERRAVRRLALFDAAAAPLVPVWLVVVDAVRAVCARVGPPTVTLWNALRTRSGPR